MSFFKKIGRGIVSAFKKAPSVVSNIFKKGENIAGQVAGGLSKVGDVLGKASDIGSQILSNPLVDMGASAIFGPEAGVGLGLAGQALKNVKTVSNLAKQGSNIANIAGSASGNLSRGNLSGAVMNAKQGIQRVQNLKNMGGVAGPQPMFA